MNGPAYYRIRVSGFVSERWVGRFWTVKGKTVQHEAGVTTTEMIGEIKDQENLMGLINILYDTGHVLTSVEQLTINQIKEVTPQETDL